MLVPIAVATFATLPLRVWAQTPDGDCFHEAAARYSVDERLLLAIAKVESNFNPSAVHANSDGTRDVGLMQINSSHFEELRPYRIDEATLLARPCVNVGVGAWILAGFIRQHGLTWRAVGSYAAGNRPEKEAARAAYALLVSRALKRVTAREGSRLVAVDQVSRRMKVVE